MNQHSDKLAAEAAAALKVISDAASEATKVIADAAAAAAVVRNQSSQEDHDAIIRLESSVSSGFASTNAAIAKLDSGTYTKLNEHENRLKIIENRAYTIGLDTMRKDINSFAEQWSTFKTKLGVYVLLVSVVAGFVGFILQQIIKKYI